MAVLSFEGTALAAEYPGPGGTQEATVAYQSFKYRGVPLPLEIPTAPPAGGTRICHLWALPREAGQVDVVSETVPLLPDSVY